MTLPVGWQDMIDKAVRKALHEHDEHASRRRANGDHVVGNTYIVRGGGGMPSIIQQPAPAAPPLPVPIAPCAAAPCQNNMLHVRIIHHNLSVQASNASGTSVPTFSPTKTPSDTPTLTPTAQMTAQLQLSSNCKFAVVQDGVVLGVMDSNSPCQH
jgi:hypothetical protein